MEKVTGKGRARKSPGVIEVYVKPRKGTKLIPPLSMGHRYAYVIATGASMEEAKKFAKNAANEIKFHLVEETITKIENIVYRYRTLDCTRIIIFKILK